MWLKLKRIGKLASWKVESYCNAMCEMNLDIWLYVAFHRNTAKCIHVNVNVPISNFTCCCICNFLILNACLTTNCYEKLIKCRSTAEQICDNLFFDEWWNKFYFVFDCWENSPFVLLLLKLVNFTDYSSLYLLQQLFVYIDSVKLLVQIW